MPDGIWLVPAFVEKILSRGFILGSVRIVLNREALWSNGMTLAANAGGRGFNPHRGREKMFFTIYSIL